MQILICVRALLTQTQGPTAVEAQGATRVYS